MLPALNSCCGSRTELVTEPVDYATTLMGTLSEFALSTGNTYPATAVPWGMNFWTPQTGTMGDGSDPSAFPLDQRLRPVRDNAGEGRLQGK